MLVDMWPHINFGAFLLFGVLAAVVLINGHRQRLNLYLALFLSCLAAISSSTFYNAPGPDGFLFVLRFVLYTWANMTPVAAALLAFLVFEDRDVSGAWFWIFAGLSIGLDSFDFFMSVHENWPRDRFLIFIFEYLPQVGKIGFLLLAIYAVAKSWRADLVQRRFRLRYLVLGFGGVVGLEMLVVENLWAIDNNIYFDPYYFHASWLFLLALASSLFLLNLRSVDWARFQVRGAPTPLKQSWVDWAPKLKMLDSLLNEREIYRDPGLNLTSLAEELGTPEYRVRELINGEMGYKNFNVFLNDHRIVAAAKDLHDENKRHLPILTIAMDVGYGSLAPFNKAFKERKGITPSEFRRNANQR